MKKKKIRVLQIVDELRRGGKERQLVELIKGIDKDKFEMYVISLLPREDGYDEEVKGLAMKFSYLNRKYKWDLSLVRELVRYCKENEIDIVYSWDGMTSVYSLLASYFTKVKFINGSIRDTDTRKSYKHLYKRLVLRLSRNVVANSNAGLKVYGAEKKGKVIYNGLDFKRFENQKIENHNKFIVGIAANLTVYKDYYTFFDAIKILRSGNNNFEVHVVGWGKMAEIYKRYAEELGIMDCVKFFGRVSDAENYISKFDVGVLCSYKNKGEGLSNSIIEYMACGIPAIITDIGAAREIVEDGKTGLLFEAGNTNDLSNKIELLMLNERLRIDIGKSAKVSVSEKFSYSKYIKSVETYYENIV